MPGRVMFVSSITRYGGGERWMCDAAGALAGRGHAVLVVPRPGSDLQSRVGMLGLDQRPVEMRGDLDPAAILRISREIKRFAPDVVCVNLDREVRICGLALRLAGRVARGANSRRRFPRLIPRRGSEFPLKNNFQYRFVYTRLVHSVIVNSLATRETMLSNTPWFDAARAVVIYNGIDFSPYDVLSKNRSAIRDSVRRTCGLAADSVLVIHIGELTERKGHRFLVDAAVRVAASRPDVHFLCAGTGNARSAIEAQIRSNGLAGRVHLLGFRKDVAELLTASDILVLPSSVEGFGYVLAEAMAASLPVVATRASSIPEVVEDSVTGLLHGVGDSERIADLLLRLLGDPRLRREMGAAGRERARKMFHIDRMISDLERLFFA